MNESASPRRVKVFAAMIGASAVVALGALTTVMHQEQTLSGGDTGYVSQSGPTMAPGNTGTTTTEPSMLDTSKAEPPVKATPFGGSGS